jgi:hypothetical protein
MHHKIQNHPTGNTAVHTNLHNGPYRGSSTGQTLCLQQREYYPDQPAFTTFIMLVFCGRNHLFYQAELSLCDSSFPVRIMLHAFAI